MALARFGKLAPLIPRGMPKIFASNGIHHLSFHNETPAELACRYECYFNRPDIDGWDIRQGMNDMMAYDWVPEPNVIIAALHACRRVNDYALTVRFLESIRNKCGNNIKQIYPYIIQEIAPTMCELGCDFPEDLGYDKPELYQRSVFDM